MHIWQSKQVLKSGSNYQVPSWVKNRVKGISKEDWEKDVKEFKYNKLLVLDKVPRVSKKTNKERKEEE